jgi:hypothetical protein
VYSSRLEAEMRLRRRAARALRVLERALWTLSLLAIPGAFILYMAGKYDEVELALVILGSTMSMFEAILIEEFAGLIERREWP